MTVRELYEYAIQKKCVNREVEEVLAAIIRERNLEVWQKKQESIVSPDNSTNISDFIFKEYTYEEVMQLFST